MNSKRQAMVLASFAADALALGVHWIYNTNVIDKKYGRVEQMLTPKLASYHRGKDKGDFTHYGDQAMLLLEMLAETPDYDGATFAKRWRAFFDTYEGYFDSATKNTLKNFEAGKDFINAGSESDDLAGATRIAPLIYRYYGDLKKLVQSVQAQTVMTHNNPLVAAAAVFLALVTHQVLDGLTPREAMTKISESNRIDKRLKNLIVLGMTKRSSDTREAIMDFGQMCEIAAALPATIHLIDKYQDDLKEALVQNIMAGGDSAARGMAVGMVLGAHGGLKAIPEDWLLDLKRLKKIEKALLRIERQRDQASL